MEVYDTGEHETVYNLRVAEWHTYFVGCQQWGWSVWAHHGPCSQAEAKRMLGDAGLDPSRVNLPQVARWIAAGKETKLARYLQSRYGLNDERAAAAARDLVVNPIPRHTASDRVVIFGDRLQTTEELARAAANTERGPLRIHGVSVFIMEPRTLTNPLFVADVPRVASQFRMFKTMGRGHYTVRLPKPVTDQVAEEFNGLFRQR